MSFFTLAVVRALKLYPDVNSMIDGDFQIKHDFQDISIAVSGPKGLMVPVIRNAENLSFRGVEEVVIQPIMYVALSYDHRIVDGRESVGFLVAVKEALENPVELLMDNNPTKALEM
ncbi:UNVERIFIED_CONTAM: hypothetical protein GTU68_066561 [Idotea baltica]|nr:hypothetical protein [Idotea baltica]